MKDFSSLLCEEWESEKVAIVGGALRGAANLLSRPSAATRGALGFAAGTMAAKPEEGENRLIKGLQYGSYGVAAPHVLRFAANPVKTIQTSWKGMGQAIPTSGKRVTEAELAQKLKGTASPFSSLRAKLFHGGDLEKATQGHRFLAERSRSLEEAARGGAKGVAEELSRRGWTMRGEYGKYIPLGGKSMTSLMAAPLVPGAADVLRGKKDVGEYGAELGTNVGFLAAPGAGLLGSLATSSAMSNIGEKGLGKLRRGGASEGAMSPEEQEMYRQLMMAQAYQQQSQG